MEVIKLSGYPYLLLGHLNFDGDVLGKTTLCQA
jgi:hypothetical protein